jgi:hypothetical protein
MTNKTHLLLKPLANLLTEDSIFVSQTVPTMWYVSWIELTGYESAYFESRWCP